MNLKRKHIWTNIRAVSMWWSNAGKTFSPKLKQTFRTRSRTSSAGRPPGPGTGACLHPRLGPLSLQPQPLPTDRRRRCRRAVQGRPGLPHLGPGLQPGDHPSSQPQDRDHAVGRLSQLPAAGAEPQLQGPGPLQGPALRQPGQQQLLQRLAHRLLPVRFSQHLPGQWRRCRHCRRGGRLGPVSGCCGALFHPLIPGGVPSHQRHGGDLPGAPASPGCLAAAPPALPLHVAKGQAAVRPGAQRRPLLGRRHPCETTLSQPQPQPQPQPRGGGLRQPGPPWVPASPLPGGGALRGQGMLSQPAGGHAGQPHLARSAESGPGSGVRRAGGGGWRRRRRGELLLCAGPEAGLPLWRRRMGVEHRARREEEQSRGRGPAPRDPLCPPPPHLAGVCSRRPPSLQVGSRGNGN